MEVLSTAASVTAVLDISTKVTSLCSQYGVEVGGTKEEIKRLDRIINIIKDCLEALRQLLDTWDKLQVFYVSSLQDSLQECYRELKMLETILQAELECSRSGQTKDDSVLQSVKWLSTSTKIKRAF